MKNKIFSILNITINFVIYGFPFYYLVYVFFLIYTQTNTSLSDAIFLGIVFFILSLSHYISIVISYLALVFLKTIYGPIFKIKKYES